MPAKPPNSLLLGEEREVFLKVIRRLNQLCNSRQTPLSNHLDSNDQATELVRFADILQCFPSHHVDLKAGVHAERFVMENPYRNLYLFLQGAGPRDEDRDLFTQFQKNCGLHMGLFAYVEVSPPHRLKYLYGPETGRLDDEQSRHSHFHLKALWCRHDDTEKSLIYEPEPSWSFFEQGRQFYYARTETAETEWVDLDFVQILQARRGSRQWHRRTAFERDHSMIYASSGEMDACILCWLLLSLDEPTRHDLRSCIGDVLSTRRLDKLVGDGAIKLEFDLSKYVGTIKDARGNPLPAWREGEQNDLIGWLIRLGLVRLQRVDRWEFYWKKPDALQITERGWRMLSWLYYYLHNLHGRRLPVLGEEPRFYYRLVLGTPIIEPEDVRDWRGLIHKLQEAAGKPDNYFAVCVWHSLNVALLRLADGVRRAWEALIIKEQPPSQDLQIAITEALNEILTELKLDELPEPLQAWLIPFVCKPRSDNPTATNDKLKTFLEELREQLRSLGKNAADLGRLRQLSHGTLQLPIIWNAIPAVLRRSLIPDDSKDEEQEFLKQLNNVLNPYVASDSGLKPEMLSGTTFSEEPPPCEAFCRNRNRLIKLVGENVIRTPSDYPFSHSWLDGPEMESSARPMIASFLTDPLLDGDHAPRVSHLLQAVQILLSWEEKRASRNHERLGLFQKRCRFNLQGHLFQRAADRHFDLYEDTSRAWLVFPVRFDEDPRRADYETDLLPVGFFLGTFRDCLDYGHGVQDCGRGFFENTDLTCLLTTRVTAIRHIVNQLAAVENREIYEKEFLAKRLREEEATRVKRIVHMIRGELDPLYSRVKEHPSDGELQTYYNDLRDVVDWTERALSTLVIKWNGTSQEHAREYADITPIGLYNLYVNNVRTVIGRTRRRRFFEGSFRSNVLSFCKNMLGSKMRLRLPRVTLKVLLREIARNVCKYADYERNCRLTFSFEARDTHTLLRVACVNTVAAKPNETEFAGSSTNQGLYVVKRAIKYLGAPNDLSITPRRNVKPGRYFSVVAKFKCDRAVLTAVECQDALAQLSKQPER